MSLEKEILKKYLIYSVTEAQEEKIIEAMREYLSKVINKDFVNLETAPYHYTADYIIEPHYNPKFGDSKLCKCGHSYYRHFDSYENMEAIGCKYCSCDSFEEKTDGN